MNPARLITLFSRTCLAAALFATCALAQSSGSSRIDNASDETFRAKVTPLDRVRGPVTDERTPFKGQTRPMDRAAVDLGEAPASMSTGRMVLWLRRSAEQQAQLSQFLSHAQNPGVGGLSPLDDAGELWRGLWHLGPRSRGRAAMASIQRAEGREGFSGAQCHSLFRHGGHRWRVPFIPASTATSVGQQKHFSNATDPEIPDGARSGHRRHFAHERFPCQADARAKQAGALRCRLGSSAAGLYGRRCKWWLRSVMSRQPMPRSSTTLLTRTSIPRQSRLSMERE